MAQLPTAGSVVSECTINKVRGATFVSPGGRRFTIEGDQGSALVLDRKSLDQRLGQLAAKEGAQIHLGCKVAEIRRDAIRVEAEPEDREYRPEIIVGATGRRSTIASMMGERSGRLIPGMQFEVGGLSLDREMVHIYLGRDVSEGLFGWLIPISSEAARIGLCSRRNPKERLVGLLEDRIAEEFGRGVVLRSNAGAIVYGIRQHTCWDRCIVVGDEALQTKPATGGGIHYSLICSEIAGRSIVRNLREGIPLSRYEGEWRRRLEREIRFGLLVRRLYEDLSDREIETIFAAVDGRTREHLSSADFDRHSTIGRAVARLLPRLLTTLGPHSLFAHLRRLLHD